MRLKMSFLLFLFIISASFSQTGDNFCRTYDDSPPDPPGVYSYSIDPALLENLEPIVYNVFFWGINREDGTSDYPLTQDDVLTAVANLNIEYNEINIFFKYVGYSHFNSILFYEIDAYEIYALVDFAELNGYVEENSFNVYVPNDCTDCAGVAKDYNRTSVAVTGERLTDNYVMAHEIGHCFDLIHTFESWESNAECERVTRDSNDGNYNATTNGDRVVDTAACSENYSTEECLYTDSKLNCDDTSYEIFEKDIRSFMGYRHNECRDSFTVGQKIRIREAIAYDELGNFTLAQTDIASLYEPYKGAYYEIGPTIPNQVPYFQPGIDYEFISCSCENDNLDCSLPSDYNETSFQNNHTLIGSFDRYETDYSLLTHPNHTAILIPQIDNQQPRKCYDNWNRGAIGGTVIKFEDEVFNANVTIMPQDSSAINNQNLINSLQHGLYMIEKNYNDGSSKESIILKENNDD